nr:MAG TPA: hypothetical protein [Caudoviricetes sp.]
MNSLSASTEYNIILIIYIKRHVSNNMPFFISSVILFNIFARKN